MNASALPDPKEVSYDLLLRCVHIAISPVDLNSYIEQPGSGLS